MAKWCAAFLCGYECCSILAGFVLAIINAADSALRSASPQEFPGLHVQFSWCQVRHALQLCLSAEGQEVRPWASPFYLESKQQVQPSALAGSRQQGWGFFAKTRKQVSETSQLNSESLLRKGNRIVYFIFSVNYKLSFIFIYFLFVRKK